MVDNWLICGTRRKDYKNFCIQKLTETYYNKRSLQPKSSDWKPIIIEGCCPDSADAYAEEWAKINEFEVLHHPSSEGNYLKRNVEMCLKASLVIAFWDGYSYGTAHTIAQATMRRIPIIIYYLKKNEVTGNSSPRLKS